MQFFEKLWRMWEIWRYQACKNQSKKKVFSVWTKLAYKKFFSDNLLAIDIKKNTDTHE